jgi:hypothetical protein
LVLVKKTVIITSHLSSTDFAEQKLTHISKWPKQSLTFRPTSFEVFNRSSLCFCDAELIRDVNMWNKNNREKVSVTLAKCYFCCLGPCTVNNGGCSQLCLPGSGSNRTCQCAIGYTSSDGGVTCQTNVLTVPFLLLLDTCLGGIYQMNTATGVIQALQVSRQVTPLALAYDNVTSTVFWSDVQLNIIKSLSLTTGVEQIFPVTRPG